jgi:serine/threonine protein kinase
MPPCPADQIETVIATLPDRARQAKSRSRTSASRRHPATAASQRAQLSAQPCPYKTVVDDRYLVLDRIGSGGTAAVYRAEDLLLGQTVALKILHPCFVGDEEFVQRFRMEASCAAAIRHEHVVSVYDGGECDGTCYIAMEYVDGRSLRSIVREEAPLAHAQAIDLAVQLLRAAGCIHRRGIIHRDLKPDNAIVDGDGRLKVTDFGIARTGASDITNTGSIVGTPKYVSPEQAQGHALSVESDLYSIGVVLFELLTGRVPFEGENVVSLALKHVNERPPQPSRFNATIPPELEACVMRALEKDPACRFTSADMFIAALERAKAALPATTPLGRGESRGQPCRRRPLAATKRWVRRAGSPAARSLPRLARGRSARTQHEEHAAVVYERQGERVRPSSGAASGADPRRAA